MSELTTCEIYICLDANGDWAVSVGEEEALDAYENEIGGDSVRIVRKLTVNIPRPASVVESGSVTLPDAPAEGPLQVTI